MDPCTLLDTQFYVVRISGGKALAVAEVPIVGGVPLNKFELTMLTTVRMDSFNGHAKWSNGLDGGREVQVDFEWFDYINDRPDTKPSCAIALLARGDGILEFEPVDETEAKDAMVLCDLDYWRATEAHKHSSNSCIGIKMTYAGKAIEDEAVFPSLEEKPVGWERRLHRQVGGVLGAVKSVLTTPIRGRFIEQDSSGWMIEETPEDEPKQLVHFKAKS